MDEGRQGGDGGPGAGREERVERRIHELRAREPGVGREAQTPARIPWRGWRDVAWRLYEEVSNDRVGMIAGGTTFFLLLALVPALAALVSLYGLIADPATLQSHLASLRGVLPAAAIELLEGELERLVSQRTDELGVTFGIGLAFALWSANSGIKALFDALNIAYDENEKRGIVALNLASLAFTLCGIAFAILAVGAVTALPILLAFLPLGALGKALVSVLPALLLFGVAVLGLSALYRFGPSRAPARWSWITPGSIVAAVVWVAASALFSWYLASFADYTATYGSLGAVIGVMTWIYISMWIVLVGAELNSELEHQTARDSTTGPERPMGQRGAAMADRVAPSTAG